MAYKIEESLRDKLREVLDQGFTEEHIKVLAKKVGNALTEAHSDFEYYLHWELAGNLTNWVADMAEHSIEAILAGDEALLRRYLSCEERGCYTGRDRDHPVIHGRLFETGCIELRKKIVDAHADLLKNERILDLEDQVKSLVQQLNKSEVHNRQLTDELNNLRPQF